MLQNEKIRKIFSFVYYGVFLLAGIIMHLAVLGSPGYNKSGLTILSVAMTAMGLNIFRFWKVLNPTKLNSFLSFISYAALVFVIFFGIGIPLSDNGMTHRAMMFGAIFLLICAFVSCPLLEFALDNIYNDAKFEFALWVYFAAPIVFFFLGILLNAFITSTAILLGVTISVFLIFSFYSGNLANVIWSIFFTVFFALIGGFDKEFINGQYYALVPVVTAITMIVSYGQVNKNTSNKASDKPILVYGFISASVLLWGSFIIQYVIILKWWLGLLILLGLILVNALVLFGMNEHTKRKEKGSGRSSSSNGDAKTESILRAKLRLYVKSGSYNAARLFSYHVTVSCQSVDFFVSYSGDTEVSVTMKFFGTDISALSNSSNLQILTDTKKHVESELTKNAKKAIDVAISQGAKLSGRFTVNVSYDI